MTSTYAPLLRRAAAKFGLIAAGFTAVSTAAFAAEAPVMAPTAAAVAAPATVPAPVPAPVRARMPAPVAQPPFQPYLARAFQLSDLNFANPLVFSGAEYSQQIFFQIPRDVPVHDLAIDLDGHYLRGDLGHSAFVASVNDVPSFAFEPKDGGGEFNRTIQVPEKLLTDAFVKLDLRYSSITTEDRCSEQRSIANIVSVAPRSLVRYRVNSADVKDVRTAWGMLPAAPRILIPAGAIDETHYAAALKISLAMAAAGRRPEIVTAPAVGEVVDAKGLTVPADLARIPVFKAFENAGKVKLASDAERGAFTLLEVIHGRAPGDVVIGAEWLGAQTGADIGALTAAAEQAGPEALRALNAYIVQLPTVGAKNAKDNLTLETVLGQPVITLANDASRAASLLATQWSRLANNDGLDVTFAGAEAVDLNSIQLGELGGNLQAQSIIQHGEWVTAFDAAQLPAGRWPSNIELEMRVSPDASDTVPMVTVMLNDVLLRAEKIDPDDETVRVRADVPPYLLASRNTLRIGLQRGPSSADCRAARGYMAQILPTSRLVLGNESIDTQFFGLKSKLANNAVIAVPKGYLADPAQSLPYVFQFLRELNVSSSSIRLETVQDAATYRPAATFVSFGVPLAGRRKNLEAANNALHLTDETGLPIARIDGARDAAVVQIVSLGEVAGLSVNSTTGKPIPGIKVTDLGEGDVAIYDASGRIGDLGAGDFSLKEIRRALMQPSAIFARYSIWIVSGMAVIFAMLVMSGVRAFVVSRKRRRNAAAAENAAA